MSCCFLIGMFADFVSGVISKLEILEGFDLFDDVRTVLNRYINVKNVINKIILFVSFYCNQKMQRDMNDFIIVYFLG